MDLKRDSDGGMTKHLIKSIRDAACGRATLPFPHSMIVAVTRAEGANAPRLVESV